MDGKTLISFDGAWIIKMWPAGKTHNIFLQTDISNIDIYVIKIKKIAVIDSNICDKFPSTDLN